MVGLPISEETVRKDVKLSNSSQIPIIKTVQFPGFSVVDSVTLSSVPWGAAVQKLVLPFIDH